MDKLKSNAKIVVEILLLLGLVLVIRLTILTLLPNNSGAQGESQPTSEVIAAQTSYPYPDILRETWEAAQATIPQPDWDGTQTYPEATIAEATRRAALTAMPQPYRDGSQPYPDLTATEATGMAAQTAIPQAYQDGSQLYPDLSATEATGMAALTDLPPQYPEPLTNPPTPIPLLLANGWYSYTEPTTGFSISYPKDTYFSASYNAYDRHFQGVNLLFHMPGNYGMGIGIYDNPKKLSVAEYANSSYQEVMGKPAPDDFVGGFSNTSVGGLPALKVMPPWVFAYIIYLVKDNTIITIEPYENIWNPDPNNKSGQTALELCEKIVATVSFKPPK